jgi:sporulation integral membrane protein YtvI
MISAKLPSIRSWIRTKISKERLQKLLTTLRHLREALWGWLRAQFKLMGITWLILTGGFILLRVPYAPLWAALTALVDALPVLGTGAVLLPWSLVCFLQNNTVQAIGLLSTYGAVSLTRSILEPKLVGKQLGLDPLVTLVAMYAGYRFWGIVGMILSPLLAVTAVQLLKTNGEQPLTE